MAAAAHVRGDGGAGMWQPRARNMASEHESSIGMQSYEALTGTAPEDQRMQLMIICFAHNCTSHSIRYAEHAVHSTRYSALAQARQQLNCEHAFEQVSAMSRCLHAVD